MRTPWRRREPEAPGAPPAAAASDAMPAPPVAGADSPASPSDDTGARAQRDAGPGAASDAGRGVPPIAPGLPRVAFIGAGRVGTALGAALRASGWPVTATASRDRSRRDRFLALVPGSRAHAEAHDVLDEADLLFLTVPDDAVPAIAASLHLYSGQAIVHTSGVLPAAVLSPALAAGTEAGSFHPLVAFTDVAAGRAALAGCVVAIEGDEPLLPLLEDVAAAIGARPVRVTAEGKPAHHAAATLAAGGLVALLDVVDRLAGAAGIEAGERLGTYQGLARQALENAVRQGPEAALTGPIVRGDLGTVRLHLDALRRADPDAIPIYVALARRSVSLATARGELSPERAAELVALLASGG